MKNLWPPLDLLINAEKKLNDFNSERVTTVPNELVFSDGSSPLILTTRNWFCNIFRWNSAMSNAPGESGSTTSYGTSSASPATTVAKRAPVYRRSLSLEQSQNIKEAEVFSKI